MFTSAQLLARSAFASLASYNGIHSHGEPNQTVAVNGRGRAL